ncbi:ABC transporter substrate-binding protein [Pseudotabrizicola sp. 4114]|uniref:ABC transporter substrate-binding protein n=1 Tax=Pseudotabrizicola sp. 4114 TaxID=2817731 RepID=UPI00286087C0|nr:peptide/nickel transport system substrate-binding protein [Pseudorhodobacter sp. 4114]
MKDIDRRLFMQLFGAAGATLLANPAFAAGGDIDRISIAWTSDPTTLDPNQRLAPDPQSILRSLFDQPLDQLADLTLAPAIVSGWKLNDDATSLNLTLRDDVTFSDGSKLTSADVRYSFFERLQAGHELDLSTGFGTVTDIEILSDTECVMKFSGPFPTAPVWLAFATGFIVSKAHGEAVGPEGMKTNPLGAGAYKLKEYTRDSRIVLERRDDYWGEKPSVKQLTFEIIPDSTARLAALESGTVDIAMELSIRDVKRLQQGTAFNAVAHPIGRLIFLTVRSDGVLADKNVRLAAHHAIDKALLSQAFFGGDAVTIDAPAFPGMQGNPPGYVFGYDEAKAVELLAASGFSPENPVELEFATSNGQFPGDYDIARAIVTMWEKVGIRAKLISITEAQWYDLNSTGKLPPISLFTWDNPTGDPEHFTGYMFNDELPFATFKRPDVTAMVKPLFSEPNNEKRIKAYEELNVFLMNEGAMIPLLQSIQTIGFRRDLAITPWSNGWMEARSISLA